MEDPLSCGACDAHSSWSTRYVCCPKGQSCLGCAPLHACSRWDFASFLGIAYFKDGGRGAAITIRVIILKVRGRV